MRPSFPLTGRTTTQITIGKLVDSRSVIVLDVSRGSARNKLWRTGRIERAYLRCLPR